MSDLITMMSAAAGQVGGFNPREYFNTVLFTGNSSGASVTGVGFQPDFVWMKCRISGRNHELLDAVRGGSSTLFSNLTTQEATQQRISSFDSDGFTYTTDSNSANSGETFVAWNWKANGVGASNGDGTITSTVSVSTTSGFSIVTYTGNGNANATVGHGLGVIPAMIICKSRSNATAWYVKHTSLASNNNLLLAGTDGQFNVATGSGNGGLGNLSSSTTFGFLSGTSSADATNLNGGTFVAYCFAEVEGFSKFGSYTGNGSATGPSVTTDFQPNWLMIKRTDTTGDWIILDSARDATNPRTEFLEPNTADAEATGNDVDFNATGFQLKSTSASINASGGTYIYACFA